MGDCKSKMGIMLLIFVAQKVVFLTPKQLFWCFLANNGNKRVLNFVQQVFFLLSTEGSLVITRAYPALYLAGTTSHETGTSPPSCLHLDNRLCMTFRNLLI